MRITVASFCFVVFAYQAVCRADTLSAPPPAGGKRGSRIPAEASGINVSLSGSEEADSSKTSVKKVRIEGDLICSMGDSNSGEPCQMKLSESGTGTTYRVVFHQDAMRLYHSGTRKVIIEGSLADSSTLKIGSIKSAAVAAATTARVSETD